MKYNTGDLWTKQIMMKKSRPAILVTILCPSEAFSILEPCIFKNTSTFGFRYQYIQRKIIERKWGKVNTEAGVIRIKIGYNGEEKYTESIEYEDLKKYAKHHNISLQIARKEILKRRQQ